jgi:hypothetical protein
MLLTYLLACHALGIQNQGHAVVEIPVHNRRASTIVHMIERGELFKTSDISANDLRGCVITSGSPDELKDLQQLVRMFDVVKRKLSVKLDIHSPVDKENFHIVADVYNNDKWKTICGESGLSVAVEPRLNSDGTVTAFLNFDTKDAGTISLVYRMKVGSSHTFSMGSIPKESGPEVKQAKASNGTDPTLTVRIDG